MTKLIIHHVAIIFINKTDFHPTLLNFLLTISEQPQILPEPKFLNIQLKMGTTESFQ